MKDAAKKLTERDRAALERLCHSNPPECQVSATLFYRDCVIHPATAKRLRRLGFIDLVGHPPLVIAVLTDEGRKAFYAG